MQEEDMQALGIDIGGSGIKGALVDIEKGELIGERHRIETPQPSAPDAVAGVVREIARSFSWTGPIGCTFPAIVRNGVTMSAANVDKRWIGTNAAVLFEMTTGCPVRVLNDADAAGIAEMTYGAGRGRERGTIMILTFGTGIGSAIFLDGKLLPNSEFGHVPMPMKGIIGEHYCSDRVRKADDLKWDDWAKRANNYLELLDLLLSPDLFIVGGGISKRAEKWLPLLKTRVPLVPAQLLNEAGIIGAAMAVHDLITA
jgi:polyphosphate glucokinase